MDFSSPPPGGKLGAVDKEHLMDQVKQQIALANAQELLQVHLMGSCISPKQLTRLSHNYKSTESQTWQVLKAAVTDYSQSHYPL